MEFAVAISGTLYNNWFRSALSEQPDPAEPRLGQRPPGEPATRAVQQSRIWGGGYTFLDRVPGQPLFLVDPNSKFDPTAQLVLNSKAWVEPPYGTFGTSAPYYNDFRWQRQPAESLALARTFNIKERVSLQIPRGIPEHLQPVVLFHAQR